MNRKPALIVPPPVRPEPRPPPPADPHPPAPADPRRRPPKPGHARPGRPSSSRSARSETTATRNVPASSSATAPAPTTTNNPAPTSGITSRSPWLRVCCAALASARKSWAPGTAAARSGPADRAPDHPVEESYRVDRPDLAALVDQEDQQNQRRRGQVRPDQQLAAAEPVGQRPAHRREHAPRHVGEEDQPRRGRTVGQFLQPDRHREPERRVPQRGDHIPEHEEPGIADPEDFAHGSPSSSGVVGQTRMQGDVVIIRRFRTETPRHGLETGARGSGRGHTARLALTPPPPGPRCVGGVRRRRGELAGFVGHRAGSKSLRDLHGCATKRLGRRAPVQASGVRPAGSGQQSSGQRSWGQLVLVVFAQIGRPTSIGSGRDDLAVLALVVEPARARSASPRSGPLLVVALHDGPGRVSVSVWRNMSSLASV